ncbi:Involved in transport from the ER to the Golgi apparatus as well as in intra-Golgi transport. It belongs to a super-family of proteins called t-SNAREs or soluble NSF (N-ethylmaleimide- sensitive factor) attachment protein receptor (By similarity) [Seminavis robusta]|uniref:Golgi SNAP receptor complex member 1 n=1 Tax=Seminavis robusta TaxID=568900 RepID=A0A9N8HQ45_9STRA|nr:Involved in transport from the ER to the Golgi apparatus as well as in intra-Golgi transport. It belongs to a super-family of proteins called t-SNAREs or soluble NSF (N-ethylmaleimide- sensitive factor) attachment protein receptor (By similarity) [Seminavis robusta]|eukprot:Sro1247_g255880.1 Involved in transport from the ER to the Golgi apparatus as well as in intra-Golgi transport. It belongs to a super-family of proteins called t-SNAREs or soluble NSF (N-ethylmaleimide- sensitive factor) attachment protein receptor (By similarity) (237) ;mRNA; f:17823-18732
MDHNQFESVKREATKLERQLEEKVARYQQLAQKCNAQSSTTSNSWNQMEQGQTNGGSTEKEQAAALQHDIQRSMQALQDCITSRLDPAANTSHQMLVVKRYREILFDLTGDYQKAHQGWQRSQERMELFKGADGSKGGGEGQDPAMDNLLRERNHIQNSLNGANQTIEQAFAIRADLGAQRSGLGRAQAGIGSILTNIPGINGLVDAIRRKRSKDDKILAGVIASCIFFTLWYLFH